MKSTLVFTWLLYLTPYNVPRATLRRCAQWLIFCTSENLDARHAISQRYERQNTVRV